MSFEISIYQVAIPAYRRNNERESTGLAWLRNNEALQS